MEERAQNEATDRRSIEVRLSTLALIIAALVAALALGVGGYFYGKSTGEDLDAARTQGAEAGRAKGAAKGAVEGYAAGFKKGREVGFAHAYPKAYRTSYAKAFDDAGLDAPDVQDIPVSAP